jgi:hypothetical protein
MEGKRWFESKTFWFGVVMVLVTIAGFFGYGDYVPEPGSWVAQVIQILIMLQPVVVIVLRMVTRQPLKR